MRPFLRQYYRLHNKKCKYFKFDEYEDDYFCEKNIKLSCQECKDFELSPIKKPSNREARKMIHEAQKLKKIMRDLK